MEGIKYDKDLLKKMLRDIAEEKPNREDFERMVREIVMDNHPTDIAKKLVDLMLYTETQRAEQIPITLEQRIALLSLFKVKGMKFVNGEWKEHKRGGDRKSKDFKEKE